MTEFQLDGKFQQISIDPTAHVELGQDVLPCVLLFA